MIGVITNVITVILGSTIGLLCKKGIPQKLADAIMIGIGLCTICIGITGLSQGSNALVTIISIVLGAVVGTLLDIDKGINTFGEWIQNKFKKKDGKNISIAEGFVTASLLFCVGSMTIVGSLNAGISGDYEMLFTKSVLDFVSSMMLSVSLGIGVLLASVFVLVFQGALVLLAGLLEGPLMASGAIGELNCVGSLLILALGLNLIKLTKIKVANYLPALLFAPFITYFFNWLTKIGVLNF